MTELQNLYKLYKENNYNEIKNVDIKFVRSQDHIAELTNECSGRVVTAFEMAKNYGDKIQEIIDFGVASLPISHSEPAKTFRTCRES